MELEEFEILEQLADDDASNLSNMSMVNKIMKRKLGCSKYSFYEI